MDLATMDALPASGLLSCFFFATAVVTVPDSLAAAMAVDAATIAVSGLFFYSSSAAAMDAEITAVDADANICLTDVKRGCRKAASFLLYIP